MSRGRDIRKHCVCTRAPVRCQMAMDHSRATCAADEHGGEGGPEPDGLGGCLNWTPCDIRVGGHELSVAEHRSVCKASIRAIREWMAMVSPWVERHAKRRSWEAALALACEARDAIAYWDGVERPKCRAMEQEAARIEALILHVEGLR